MNPSRRSAPNSFSSKTLPPKGDFSLKTCVFNVYFQRMSYVATTDWSPVLLRAVHPTVPRAVHPGGGAGRHLLPGARWGSTRCIQLTHSLKAPGFNPCAYRVRNWFQSLLFKRNVYRYSAGCASCATWTPITCCRRSSPSPACPSACACSRRWAPSASGGCARSRLGRARGTSGRLTISSRSARGAAGPYNRRNQFTHSA